MDLSYEDEDFEEDASYSASFEKSAVDGVSGSDSYSASFEKSRASESTATHLMRHGQHEELEEAPVSPDKNNHSNSETYDDLFEDEDEEEEAVDAEEFLEEEEELVEEEAVEDEPLEEDQHQFPLDAHGLIYVGWDGDRAQPAWQLLRPVFVPVKSPPQTNKEKHRKREQ